MQVTLQAYRIIPPVLSGVNFNVRIQLESSEGHVGFYCNPSWGGQPDESSTIAQSKNAVWYTGVIASVQLPFCKWNFCADIMATSGHRFFTMFGPCLIRSSSQSKLPHALMFFVVSVPDGGQWNRSCFDASSSQKISDAKRDITHPKGKHNPHIITVFLACC